MKRIILLLLCVLLAALTGCDASETTTGTAQDASQLQAYPERGTVDLEYAVNGDGTTCTVVGVGECTDAYVRIPDYLDGCAVTAIGPSAFYCNENLQGIILGKYVQSIGDYAFYGCQLLSEVVFNEAVTEFGSYAFAVCPKLTRMEIPESLERIGAWAFYGCSGLQEVEFSSVAQLFDLRFEGIYANPLMLSGALWVDGEELTALAVPLDVTEIGQWTLAGCEKLTELRIHDGVTVIGQRAFLRCEALTSIRYDGTLEQWKAITFGEYWDHSIDEYTVICQDAQIKG